MAAWNPDGSVEQIPGTYATLDKLIDRMQFYAVEHDLLVKSDDQIRDQHQDFFTVVGESPWRVRMTSFLKYCHRAKRASRLYCAVG